MLATFSEKMGGRKLAPPTFLLRWRFLLIFFAVLTPYWPHLGCILEPLGPYLGSILDDFGPMLASFWEPS